MGEIHFYTLTIRETYLDIFGHVNNARYLTLFEEARWDILNRAGYGWKTIQEHGIGPTLLRVDIKFLKELLAGDQIVIETSLDSFERKFIVFKQIMKRGQDICCEALFTLAIFDIRARKIISPPPGWRRIFGLPLA